MLLGISCGRIVKRLGYDRTFELCRKSGFDAVDVNLELYGKKDDPNDIYNASDDEFEAHFAAIKEKAGKNGLIISQTHGRCTTYTPDEKQCEYTRWVCEKDLKATRLLGAPACVIHHTAGSEWPDNYADGEFMHAKSRELYDHLIPLAEANDVCLGVETFGRVRVNGGTDVDVFAREGELKKLYDSLDTRNKMICLDTGHTHEVTPFGTPSVAETIRSLGRDIKLLHLHDNNSSADQHLPPIIIGRNVINWPEVFDALDEIGYNGVYSFELILDMYGEMMPDAVMFLGKYLRYFVENKGRVR